MNFEQIKGILERVATIGVTWLVAKGLVPQGVSGDLVTLIVLAGSIAWGWRVNTPKALDSAAKATHG